MDNLSDIIALQLTLQGRPEGANSLSDPELISQFMGYLESAASTVEGLFLDVIHEDGRLHGVSDLAIAFHAMNGNVIFPRLQVFWLNSVFILYRDFMTFLGKQINGRQVVLVHWLTVWN